MPQGVEYIELKCRYLDFNGKIFGKITENLAIEKFSGAQKINSLKTFPIHFHHSPSEIKKHFTACGRQFVTLMEGRHREYEGQAFHRKKDGLHSTTDSRI